jgi:hypothetical protein
MTYHELASTTAKCYAKGRDAANANLRKHNRSDWNREDYDIAIIVTHVCLLSDPEKTEAELCNNSSVIYPQAELRAGI